MLNRTRTEWFHFYMGPKESAPSRIVCCNSSSNYDSTSFHDFLLENSWKKERMRERGKELAMLKEKFSSSMTLPSFLGILTTQRDVKPKNDKLSSNKERKRQKKWELVSKYLFPFTLQVRDLIIQAGLMVSWHDPQRSHNNHFFYMSIRPQAWSILHWFLVIFSSMDDIM